MGVHDFLLAAVIIGLVYRDPLLIGLGAQGDATERADSTRKVLHRVLGGTETKQDSSKEKVRRVGKGTADT